jgi:hypothetical protein
VALRVKRAIQPPRKADSVIPERFGFTPFFGFEILQVASQQKYIGKL